MTERLRKAFDTVSQLPEREQDAVADWLMQELASDARWHEAFSRSQDELARLAREATDEHHLGKTMPFRSDEL